MATSCFNAYFTGYAVNATGDGTDYPIIFDTLLFDDNNDYDNVTGIFTAPISGKYLFTTTVLGQNLGVNSQPSVFLVTTARTYFYANNGHAFEGNNLFSYTVIADMAESDTAQVIFNVHNGTKTVNVYGDNSINPRTFFAGYQVA